MKTIDDILKEQHFTAPERLAFHEILNEAKRLQQQMSLDDLKQFINAKVNELTTL